MTSPVDVDTPLPPYPGPSDPLERNLQDLQYLPTYCQRPEQNPPPYQLYFDQQTTYVNGQPYYDGLAVFSTKASSLQQPQDQSVFTDAVVVSQDNPGQSFVAHIVFASIAIFFCAMFGAAALYLAVSARNSRGDAIKARHLGYSSLGLSTVGVVIGIGLVIGLVVGILSIPLAPSVGCYYC